MPLQKANIDPKRVRVVDRLDLLPEGERLRDQALATLSDIRKPEITFARSLAKMLGQSPAGAQVGSDDIRLAWIDSGMAEPDNWLFLGAVFDKERWEHVGDRNSRIPDRHANRIRLWRLRQA